MASKRYLCAPLKNKPQYTLFSQLILQVFLSCPLINLILKSIRPEPNRISSTQNFEGLKLLTRMRLGLSHLADHKYRHNFQDCLNPICSCCQEIETKSHFLLHWFNYRCARIIFFEKINLIDSNILYQSD